MYIYSVRTKLHILVYGFADRKKLFTVIAYTVLHELGKMIQDCIIAGKD